MSKWVSQSFASYDRYNFIYNKMVDMETDMQQFEAAVREYRDGLPQRFFWREATAQHFDTITGPHLLTPLYVEVQCLAVK